MMLTFALVLTYKDLGTVCTIKHGTASEKGRRR